MINAGAKPYISVKIEQSPLQTLTDTLSVLAEQPAERSAAP